jgi:hypothetical protein
MNTKTTITLLMSTVALVSCQKGHTAKFTVRLTNDAGTPVSGYHVRASIFDKTKSDLKKKDVWAETAHETDKSGLANFEMQSWDGKVGFNLSQGLTGEFYRTVAPIFKFQRVENGRWFPDNPMIDIVLKRKRNPIAMYAKNLTSEGGAALRIPARDLAFAYDFVIGDWIPPNGKGVNGDIVFQYSFQQEASGDSRRVIRITFTNPQDGLVIFDADQWHGSKLTSDYLAPESGYRPLFEMKRTIVKGVVTDERSLERNYYFRVRTKVNSDGKIVSANYGKIYGDFMYFTYYFNPIPNDRNVEFDPDKNLFRDVPNLLKVERP